MASTTFWLSVFSSFPYSSGAISDLACRWDQWTGSIVFVGAIIDDFVVNGTGAGVIGLAGVSLADSTRKF